MTADPFDTVVEAVLGREGGYSNDPRDSGGATMWGITQGVARAEGYTGAMSALTRDQAKAILRRRYWSGPGLDRIGALSARVAAELFDTAVNMGPATAITALQRCLNAFNRQATDYPDLNIDGRSGPSTEAALRAFLKVRGTAGETVLVKALNCLQGARYIELTEARPADEAFAFGWLLNRVSLAA